LGSNDVAAQLDTKRWCERALGGVLSLWDNGRCQAWRGSQEYDAVRRGEKRPFRPTITYHALTAMAECGLFLPQVRLNKSVLEVTPAQLTVAPVSEKPDADAIFKQLIKDNKWATTAIDASMHGGGATGPAPALTPTSLPLFGQMIEGLHRLARHVPIALLATAQDHLIAGLSELDRKMAEEVLPKSEILLEEPSPAEPAQVSPQLVLYAAIALVERKGLLDYLTRNIAGFGPKWFASGDLKRNMHLDGLLRRCRSYFSRQIDRQMARKHLPLHPEYDCASLALALNGLVMLDETARDTPFFRTAVQAVVEGQKPDGCWPEGMSIASYERGQGPVPQPSVEIAMQLAGCVVRRSALYHCTETDVQLLGDALPALRRKLEYLAATFQELEFNKIRYSGWADDRLRAPGEVRMQINAWAARLINAIRLGEIARSRAETLGKYRPAWPAEEPWRGGRQPDEVWSEVTDPDQITKPRAQLLAQFIEPIAEQMRRGHFFLRPAKDGVSFILYGPPGSGKTFVVSRFAAALGWPLVSLNPGHFIQKGLESIEAVAGELFADLRKLDHVVVFFDECDELFRDRSLSSDAGGRTILSFATASMLPKLQDLHDARKVVFILGTNYLRNIDRAIRREGRFDALLLSDRPDRAAREQIAGAVIRERRGLAPGAPLPGPDHDLARQIAERSAGWMIKQVRAYAERCADAKKPLDTSVSIADYAEWCATDGELELRAAGIDGTTMNAVLDRWKPLLPAALPPAAP
jgi:hypothetical protein